MNVTGAVMQGNGRRHRHGSRCLTLGIVDTGVLGELSWALRVLNSIPDPQALNVSRTPRPLHTS